MSVFSVSGSNNDFYSMFFNTSGSNKNNNAASIFGGGNTAIGDMSLIKSGAYKKLLKSYYATVKESDSNSKSSGSSSTMTTAQASAAKDSAGSLKTVETDASALVSSLKELGNRSLYKNKTDDSGNKILGEKGEAVYDTEKISSAVKKYVESYNSFIESSGKLNSTSILNKTLDVISNTRKNAGLLSDIGITIGDDNKLKLDETKLGKAKMTTINSLFAGSGSYGSTVYSRASASGRLANSTAYANTHGSSYTYRGSYSMLGTTGSNSISGYM
ncbi:MAG: flagellar filament capping protein FliD [Lachnospiraceae bacterium]|nr:flagellar filament capping protein FliD [Lachnospiraceae bacterium]